MKVPIALVLACALVLPAQAAEIILAKNAWTTVTKADFEAEIARIPKSEQFTFLASAERVARMVETILVNKTLAAQARAEKLDKSPTVAAELESAADRVLSRHRLDQFESTLKLPDFTKRAEEIYRLDPKKYADKDVYRTKHVLVDTKCRTKEAAEKRAHDARAALIQGRPFEEVVKEFSDDTGVELNKGDVGALPLDKLTPAYAEAVKKMRPGDLSEPVLSNFGYHIIRLEEVKKGRQYAFEEVRASLVAELKEKWVGDQRKEFVRRITVDPALKLELEAIQALKTTIGEQPQPVTPK